jgi:L-lysine 2,3-aminomutase
MSKISDIKACHPEHWNDCIGKFKNRITTYEELTKYIACKPKTKLSLRIRFSFSDGVTPHYLSLIDHNNILIHFVYSNSRIAEAISDPIGRSFKVKLPMLCSWNDSSYLLGFADAN